MHGGWSALLLGGIFSFRYEQAVEDNEKSVCSLTMLESLLLRPWRKRILITIVWIVMIGGIVTVLPRSS